MNKAGKNASEGLRIIISLLLSVLHHAMCIFVRPFFVRFFAVRALLFTTSPTVSRRSDEYRTMKTQTTYAEERSFERDVH